jgi:hypothetical protein
LTFSDGWLRRWLACRAGEPDANDGVNVNVVPGAQTARMHPEVPDFTGLLEQRPPAVAAQARNLRTAVLDAFPDVTERYYPGWQGLGFKHPLAGLLGTLFAREDDVVVYLERGAELPDPFGMLGGAERLRRTRTLTFAPGAAPDHLVEYLDLAIEHGLATRRRSPGRAPRRRDAAD